MEATVSAPLLWMAMAPVVDVTALLKLTAATDARLMEVAFKIPLKVEVPVAEVMVKGPATIASLFTRTVAALATVNAVNGFVWPMVP